MSKMSLDCWDNYPNFNPKEFACPCGCQKQVYDMDCRLVRILQKVREKYKKPVVITCGYRCKKYNDSLVKKGWAVANSYHVKKKAVDFYISGLTNTPQKREEIIKYMKTLEGFNYAYHDDGTHANMGIAIHIQVK